jgi:hypothetical protein
MATGLEVFEDASSFRRLAGCADASSKLRVASRGVLSARPGSVFTLGGRALGGLNVGAGLAEAEGMLVIATAF